MVDTRFERRDISLAPEYDWLVFGDGYFAQIIEIVMGKDSDNQPVWKMRIRPTIELIKKYNITTDSIDESRAVDVEYPVDMIQQLSKDPSHGVYFCFLNYLGETTDSTKFWKGFVDLEKMRGLRYMLELKNSENAFLKERLERALTNVRETIKEDIQGPASEISATLIAQSMTQKPQGGLGT